MKKGWEQIIMGNIKIFPMRETDIDSVYDISKKSLKTAWSLHSLRKELDNKFAKYIVAKIEEKIIGFGGIWIVFDEAHIINIAVHPDYRSLGAGELLLKSLFSICIDNNVSDITLEVRPSNIKALNLYKKFGFNQEGLRKSYYSDNNEDALIMWKRNIKK